MECNQSLIYSKQTGSCIDTLSLRSSCLQETSWEYNNPPIRCPHALVQCGSVCNVAAIIVYSLPPFPLPPPTHRCGLLPPFTCSVSEAAQPGTCLSQTQGCWHDPRGHKRPQRRPASQPHAVSQGQTQHCSSFSCMHACIHTYMINMHVHVCIYTHLDQLRYTHTHTHTHTHVRTHTCTHTQIMENHLRSAHKYFVTENRPLQTRVLSLKYRLLCSTRDDI